MFCRDNFIITARLQAQPGKEAELKQVLQEGVRACFGQEGLLIYNLHQDKDDPSVFLLYGHFTSEASYRMHMDSEPIRKAYDQVVGFIEDGPEIKFWNILEKVGRSCGF
ncbi:putative quinol monooxygenase [Maridesulfovibrio salexigens]|uniref:Antibiotic biosynthesis monooxygenase n=1 Tax=Maridesulfovibrio salexigens (strain ATCC 14822 / DSM 2638 / NCIMB 8403 / VKM B-1763) TaxID=526222 RepID=C6BTX5_MARSD|nr:putative quinol monooxygenase [Maridesulfovibrio salexigens]ACS79905.1 Antibiotic biosynthesis monooxygenase [Maridesulfovibrio salexigens DSM 2638]